MFVQEFGRLAAGGRLKGFSLVGRRSAASDWWGGERPVDPAAALDRLVPDLLHREIYLCGPGPWMTQVQETLQGFGIPSTSIHAEEFAW